MMAGCGYLAEHLAKTLPVVVVEHGLEPEGQVLLVTDALVDEMVVAEVEMEIQHSL